MPEQLKVLDLFSGISWRFLAWTGTSWYANDCIL
jgi:hypothetical protein